MSTKSSEDHSVPRLKRIHHVSDNSDVQETEPTLIEEQSAPPKRVIKPTQKIRENFEATRDEFHDNLDDLWERIEQYIAALPRFKNDATELGTALNRLSVVYNRYQRLSKKFITFLSNSDIEDASAELAERETILQRQDALVQSAKDKAEQCIAHLQEVRSHCSTSSKLTASSSRSSRSRRSTLCEKLIETRASAEEASVRSSYSKKEAQAEAQLKILQMEREEAAALAKLKILEQALRQDTDLDCFIPGEMEDPFDRTTDYVLKQSSIIPPASQTDLTLKAETSKLCIPPPLPVYQREAPTKHQMLPLTNDKVTYSNEPADLLETKKQLNAYATSFCPDTSQPYTPQNLHTLGVPQVNPATRIGRSDMSDFARYMIRRELIKISFAKFDDRLIL